MGGKSTYLNNKVLDHVLGGGDYSRPATVYIALFTVLPSPAGTGGTEVTGGDYARAEVTNNDTNWPAASNGTKSNGTAINFAEASGSWGTIVGFGIYDALTTGNMLYFGNLLTQKTIGSGDTFSFAVGNITITEG